LSGLKIKLIEERGKEMKPVNFKEANRILYKREGNRAVSKGDGNRPLAIYTDGEECISCWVCSFWERIQVLLFGKVWIFVESGRVQPPITAMGTRTCFLKKAKENIS
jgi:hypothetical protein